MVRCGAGRTAWGLAAVFGVVSGVFWVGGALVPVFNLVMGVPLKVACSEATIAFGDAVACLSAGFKLFRFDGGGGRVGACCGEGRAAGGFASRRGCAVICRRLHGGVLLTVAVAGCRGRGGAGFRLGAGGGRRLGGVVV